jgi:hypothetical protein
MSAPDAHLLSLAIRWVHVASMALALGGALLVCGLSVGDRPDRLPLDQLLLGVAVRYEWLFWGALGLLVITGLGNIGYVAAAVPEPRPAWSHTLAVKLVAVLGLMAFSLVRTLVVVRLRTASPSSMSAPPSRGLLQTLYATTALALASILGLAIWLAHG